MTLSTSNPRATQRWLGLLVSVVTASLLAAGAVLAAPGTEASVTDYSQCANDKPGSTGDELDCVPQGWIFGILNANNSQYSEDEVTAQRLILSLPKNGSLDRSVQLKYLVRKGTHHAYDSLATWDHTQVNANPCQSLNTPTTAACQAAITAGAATIDIDADSSVVTPNANPGATTTTSTHQLSGQQFELYGTGFTGTGHGSMSYGTLVDESGDLYQTVTINYSVASLSSARTVVLLFGGHLAAGGVTATGSPRGWGNGNGAADISGGPYHIKLIQVDGASIGNRDNQIMSSAILPLTVATIATTPSGSASTSWSATLSDSAHVTGTNPGGTVTFNLYAPGDTTCTTSIFTATVAVDSSGDASSGNFTDVGSAGTYGAGTYQWTASYSGDANNAAAPAVCGVSGEQEVVTAATSASVNP